MTALRAVQSATPARPPVRRTEARRTVHEEMTATPEHAETLLDVLDWHVQTHPQRLHIALTGAMAEEEEITYAALAEGAAAIAAGLQERELQPGQTVALMLPTCRGFFESLYGTLLAGGILVPLYPPLRLSCPLSGYSTPSKALP